MRIPSSVSALGPWDAGGPGSKQPGSFRLGRVEMIFLTSAECRTKAEQKLAEANCDRRHRRRLTTAAEGWLEVAAAWCGRRRPNVGR